MINDIQKTAESKMQRSVEVLKENLAKVRTGRAHTGLLDQVEVEYWAGQSRESHPRFKLGSESGSRRRFDPRAYAYVDRRAP